MWQFVALLFLAQTQIIDDPFESSIIYITALDRPGAKADMVYADESNCSFIEVSDRGFASSKQRGAKEASSFLEFRLTVLRRASCTDSLEAVDITQARYIGALEADVDVKALSSNCAGSVCKAEYSVSTRLTSGLSSLNDEVVLKFGAPHATSFLVRFPLKSYLAHRGEVLR